MQPLTGLALVYVQGYSLREPWLIAPYAVYLLAFAAWAPVMHLHLKIRNLARAAARDGGGCPAEAWRTYRMWFALGSPAVIALVGIFTLMVAKTDYGF